MLYQIIELAVNGALEHDAQALQKLAAISGKTVELEIKNSNQRVFIDLQPHGVELSGGATSQADVKLAATVSALTKIARHGMEDAELESGELEIQGDPILAQKFAKIMAELDIDWEDLLSEHFGEGPAKVLSFGFDQAREVVTQSSVFVKQRISDIVKNDLELFAEKEQVENFLEGVDTLRADADRLAARIQRLQAQI